MGASEGLCRATRTCSEAPSISRTTEVGRRMWQGARGAPSAHASDAGGRSSAWLKSRTRAWMIHCTS